LIWIRHSAARRAKTANAAQSGAAILLRGPDFCHFPFGAKAFSVHRPAEDCRPCQAQIPLAPLILSRASDLTHKFTKPHIFRIRTQLIAYFTRLRFRRLERQYCPYASVDESAV